MKAKKTRFDAIRPPEPKQFERYLELRAAAVNVVQNWSMGEFDLRIEDLRKALYPTVTGEKGD